MADIKLKIKRRAFPSHGIVRINTSSLFDLDVVEGDPIDLINEGSGKTTTVTVIADTMVSSGEIRVSEADLNAIGLKDGDQVLVKKTPPLEEKVKKVVADASKSLSENIDRLNDSVKKTAGDVKAEAVKTAETVETGTKAFADKAGKAASDAKDKVKKHLDGKDWL
jgi:ABC-type oligopeptide transport system ATPase subunit